MIVTTSCSAVVDRARRITASQRFAERACTKGRSERRVLTGFGIAAAFAMPGLHVTIRMLWSRMNIGAGEHRNAENEIGNCRSSGTSSIIGSLSCSLWTISVVRVNTDCCSFRRRLIIQMRTPKIPTATVARKVTKAQSATSVVWLWLPERNDVVFVARIISSSSSSFTTGPSQEVHMSGHRVSGASSWHCTQPPRLTTSPFSLD